MTKEQLLEQLLPHIGGEGNIARTEGKNGSLLITVKDRSLVDLNAVQALDGVSAELTRARLKVTAENLKTEEEPKMAKDYKALSQQILKNVGGKENVTYAAHCMTRLRLSLRDNSAVDIDAVKKIPGVLGAQFTGEQFQIIIGQDVPKLYDVFCADGGFAKAAAVDENPDAGKAKEPFSLKKIGGSIMDALTGVMSPLIPVIMVAAMIRMVVAVFGPDMLGVMAPESDIYRLLSFLGDAGFYFFPVLVGYSGARKFGCSPVLAILMGGILLHPSLIEIVNAGEPFTVFGLPMTLATYGSTLLPMLLITWVMSYVERFFKKYIPDVLSTVFVPLCTVLVMVPLALCVLGPAGSILGNYVSDALIFIHDVFGPFGMAVIGGVWILLIATGMHMAMAAPIMLAFASFGYDPTVVPASAVTQYVSMAVSLAVAIKAKNAEDRSVGVSCLVSQALGGVGEPTLFGIMFRFKKALAFAMAGSFCGALTAGLLGARGFSFASGNFLTVLCYGPDVVKGAIACAVAFAVSFALIMVFGYEDKKNA